ncbi:MAG TPA: ubiquinone/menaquinone biosynthesis methyltransferase [Acidimicrobiales bacterium]
MRQAVRAGTAPGALGAPLPTGKEKLEKVQQMFDEVAPRYELVNTVMTFGMDRSWRRRTINALALRPGARVLDLACGTGDLARELYERGYQSVGLDLSEGMLRAAHDVAAPLLVSDAAALPFANSSFEGVVSGFALRNIAELQASFDECARITRSLGRVALLEVDRPSNPLVRVGHDVWFKHGVPRIGALLSVREAYRYLPRSVEYLPPPPELAVMLEKAGFTHIEHRSVMLGTVQIVTATRLPRTSEPEAHLES